MPGSKTKARKASFDLHHSQAYATEDESRVEQENGSSRELVCCAPRGCRKPKEPITEANMAEAVKAICNNEDCDKSGWMHSECFNEWEDHVLGFLKSCGRARSWNDKQRIQNLWTKKGYDLAYKACDCLCGKGHLRKDLDFIRTKDDSEDSNSKKNRNHRRNEKPMPITKSQPIPVNGSLNGTRPRIQIRPRAVSFSSTGSSPPNSLSPGGSPVECRSADKFHDAKFEFALTQEQAAAGNIFHHRPNLQVFKKLPAHKRNPYHIKMEDEGPYGNDETRCFVLASLSTRRITSLPCVVCGQDMKIFDRYPLVDGTLFLTPQKYISDICLHMHGQNMYMNAVCMMCAEGIYTELRCKQCSRPWNGSALQVGTMYSYDVFAANACCMRRLQCKNCGRVALGSGQDIPFFSQFSHAHQCCHCKATGYHFVKPLNEIFHIYRH